ncbi:hypothetical protein [Gemmata sp.]|uniref:hypothetical protein n=1 Tax=Gemmata sp. TaxID=1914242 RepID=UPI003F730489
MRPSPAFRVRVACGALALASVIGCERVPPTRPAKTVTTSRERAAAPRAESPAERVARRLGEVHPGMTQPEVEEILGPPTADEMRSAGADELATTSYWCLIPGDPAGRHVVTLLFNATETPPQLMAVTGPHPVPADR